MEQGRERIYVYYGQWNTPLGQGALKSKPSTPAIFRSRCGSCSSGSEQLSRQLSGRVGRLRPDG